MYVVFLKYIIYIYDNNVVQVNFINIESFQLNKRQKNSTVVTIFTTKRKCDDVTAPVKYLRQQQQYRQKRWCPGTGESYHKYLQQQQCNSSGSKNKKAVDSFSILFSILETPHSITYNNS